MNAKACTKYWDDVAKEAKEEAYVRITKWQKVARNWLADYADRRAFDFLKETVDKIVKLGSSAKVLDVGCGPGKWTKFYAKRCSLVTSIDVSPEMITLAREHLKYERITNVDFHVMNVTKLALPEDNYDLVNCVTVLQHILDDNEWKAAVRRIVKVTKPQGKILLYESAPNLTIIRRTPHLHIVSMKDYIAEFDRADANLIHWRAADLSFPITFFGLSGYAASFNKKVYYFVRGKPTRLFSEALSLFSRIASQLAEPIDYRLGTTPLGYLSLGRIMVFEKNA